MSTPKVSIVIYTVYHHIYKLAVEAQHGLKAAGVQSTIYQGIVYKSILFFLICSISSVDIAKTESVVHTIAQ